MRDYYVRFVGSMLFPTLLYLLIGVIGILFGGIILTTENRIFIMGVSAGIFGYGLASLFLGFIPCHDKVEALLEDVVEET